ncbi:MAG TPA: hypothetical protein VKC51_10460 [Lacunisphaera sp.]|nr:hypothetical protein [Lacunisphaera sp.]
MRTNFSPTAEAARLLTARDNPPGYAVAHPAAAQTSTSQPGASAERWCEWPRRAPATRQVTGIWQTLKAIQARHA